MESFKLDSFKFKILILVLLCFQNSSFVIMLRYSRSVLKQTYLTSSTLIYTEVVKLVLSLIFCDWSKLKEVIMTSHLLFPVAAIYYIQNYLMYFSLKNLDAATYSVLVQLKIVTSAIFFVILIGKKISDGQWRALVLLVIGVTLVQHDVNTVESKTSNFLGVMSGLGIALCSGLASIYFEFVLKNSASANKFSVFDRNIQLALWSIILGTVSMLPETNIVLEKGFFGGYTLFTHFIIFWSGIGGILVGLAVKSANSVVKNFANAAGMILTAFASVYIFNNELLLHHWMGIFVVVISMFDYQASEIQEPPSNLSSSNSTILPMVRSEDNLEKKIKNLINDNELVKRA